METQKNKCNNAIILISLVIFFSCKSKPPYSYTIPYKVNLVVNDVIYELNDTNKLNSLMKDINNGKLMKDDNLVPYLFDVFFVYKDTIINLKSDGIYYIDKRSKIYPKNDLVKKYWNLEDKDLLPLRTLEKL